MKINGIDGRYGVIRGPLRSGYNYGVFPRRLNFVVINNQTKGRTRKSVDVKRELNSAWRFISRKAAAHQACNQYFRKLARRKSLAQILKEPIVLYALQPKPGKTDSDLPRGASGPGGKVIGINLLQIANQNRASLCATLIHELAHVAGASIDSKSIEAETALKHCLLSQHFDPKALGVLHEREMERFAPTRVA